jgi:hypothetical protein
MKLKTNQTHFNMVVFDFVDILSVDLTVSTPIATFPNSSIIGTMQGSKKRGS